MVDKVTILDYQEISEEKKRKSLFWLKCYTLLATGLVLTIFFRIVFLFLSP